MPNPVMVSKHNQRVQIKVTGDYYRKDRDTILSLCYAELPDGAALTNEIDVKPYDYFRLLFYHESFDAGIPGDEYPEVHILMEPKHPRA